MKIRINNIFRYKRPYNSKENKKKNVDGFPNYFYSFKVRSTKKILTDSGITGRPSVKAVDGYRNPLITILTTPQKVGSEETPWQDVVNTDMGYLRYFGDNKSEGKPELAKGNKILLEQRELHAHLGKDKREKSVPLLIFENYKHQKKRKGYRKFLGFGLIKEVKLVSQIDKNGKSFSNYSFDIAVLKLVNENEELNWQWIIDRHDQSLSLKDTLKHAPKSWKEFVSKGPSSIERNTRRITELLVHKKEKQMPLAGTKENKCLKEIYFFYRNKKHRFELLASYVAKSILKVENCNYIDGWLTSRSADGGADFVSRMDIGSGFSTVRQVIYGQAKCISLSTPVSGQDIARTVARLRRGWLGVFVSTSYYSESVQREVLQDEYPIMLIPGKKLAEEVFKMSMNGGYKKVAHFIKDLDDKYEESVSLKRPDEILKD